MSWHTSGTDIHNLNTRAGLLTNWPGPPGRSTVSLSGGGAYRSGEKAAGTSSLFS